MPAMRITAYMYAGLVEKNLPESFRWYLKAAELGEKKSACEVAKYYALGKGTEKNSSEADKWLATLDDEDYRSILHELATEDYECGKMQVKMGDAYFYGDGVPRDVQKALACYNAAARYSWHEYYFEARTKLAWIYELGEEVDKDLAKADEYWEELPPECKPARA